MTAKRVFHIHTDTKFISDTSRFEGKYFENHIIIIAKESEWPVLKKLNYENIYLFDFSKRSLSGIVDLCNNSDLVVLYDLNWIKCKIALILSPAVKIAWRFFGHELYGREWQLYCSDSTLQATKSGKGHQVIKKLINGYSSIKHFIKWGPESGNLFVEGMKRVDYFMCFSQEEYDYLAGKWSNLPLLIRLSINHHPATDTINISDKGKTIIIGNNRSIYNNNLDVIDIIEDTGVGFRYKFLILFTYGEESGYSQKVRNSVKGREYYRLIEEFMTLDDFNLLYKKAAGAVFYGYRQMALGNIFAALEYGVKLYLKDINSISSWLRNNGIIISSTEDLSNDLLKGDILLTNEEIENNQKKWQMMLGSYTKHDFQKHVLSELNSAFKA